MTNKVQACIGLGANIGHPVVAVRNAIAALAELPDCRLLAASKLYRTPAWGGIDQPDFINAAVVLETQLAPTSLLRQLLDIERRVGRQRDVETASMKWGPRVLDLDLLLFGTSKINEPGLRVPHPHLHERAFALVPLAEIAPEMEFPGHGRVADALRQVDAGDIVPLTPTALGVDENTLPRKRDEG